MKVLLLFLPLFLAVSGRPRNRCGQEMDPGVCRALIPRYYFNWESGYCVKFYYGGCMGNENNFETLEECKTTCQR